MVFNHSIKVPSQYKKAASILKTAFEKKKSLKALIYEETNRMRGVHVVLKRFVDNREDIDNAIEKSEILVENPRLEQNLCRVLVTELIYGRKQLNGNSKPVETVRSYKKKILAILGGENFDVTPKTDPKPRYVRVNTNVLSIADALEFLASEEWRLKTHGIFEKYEDFLTAIRELEEDEFMLDMHVNGLLIFHPKQKRYWACHHFVTEKKFMLQDKGTCLVGELLQPPSGSVVLDMCAAPGMKTIQICNIMQNKGKIYSIEQDRNRFNLLCNFSSKANCEIVETIHADALTIDAEQCPNVEYILVDPSCSGSGMQSRMSLEKEEKDPERLKKLAGLQILMLLHAMKAFPNVKRIAYSTCSLYEEENEQVVQRCLKLNPQFKLLSGKKALRNKWSHTGNTEYKNIGKNCLYTRPDVDLSDGIFIAIFEKCRQTEDGE